MPDRAAFDLDAFLSLPRLEKLAVSPDGRRLVTVASLPGADGTGFTGALWELDPAGAAPPRRLTRSVKGEQAPRFTPGGDLLFVSARPDAAGGGAQDGDGAQDGGGEPQPSLWRLPADGGEAVGVAAPPSGVSAYAVARDHGRVVLAAAVHPGAEDWEADAAIERARTERGVTAQLHDSYPVRYWDHWYGPRQRQLFAQRANGEQPSFASLLPEPRHGLEAQSFDVAPDGSAVVTSRAVDAEDPRDRVSELVWVPLDAGGAPGAARVLLAEPRQYFEEPAFSPDGREVACVRRSLGTPEGSADQTLAVVDVATGSWSDPLAGFDRWPRQPLWLPHARALVFTADDDGHCPPFRVDLDSGAVTRLAATGAFTDLVAAPDGGTLYALRSTVAEPPQPVALDPGARDQEPRRIDAPHGEAVPPGLVERVEASADDGTRVPGWLVLPPGGDGPAPLAVLIHGGPLSSWQGWHWRWNPHVFAARGWAVLLPDPALSTGYGVGYVQRGWGRWGAEPYTDLMALVEAVAARAEVDGARAAALGGSFGGYMANWIAGHSDRFDAIVTHASIWHLEAFHGVTDLGTWWENEFGDRYREPERYRRWSPHRFVDRIGTPMLVIHGDRDYRVPVSEGLALWTDLRRHGVEAAYLSFPDEHHWVLTPAHVRLWYETVLAFCDHHVLGKPFQRPVLL